MKDLCPLVPFLSFSSPGVSYRTSTDENNQVIIWNPVKELQEIIGDTSDHNYIIVILRNMEFHS